MTNQKVQRRLAAVLAADVVGFSRLMDRDEAGTLRRLKDQRRRHLEPALRRHGGRLVKLTGDGVLAEFSSVVDALVAAVELQRDTAAFNRDVDPARRIEYRVGVHVGDVISDGDDIYGEGVNLAARLEGVAPVGGIAVSRGVRDAVRGKIAVAFEDRGPHALKNIDKPTRIFHVTWSEADWPVGAELAARMTPMVPRETGGRSPPRWAVIAAVAVLAIGAGAVATMRYFDVVPSPTAPAGDATPVATAQVPSIAVLAFANVSDEPSQDYFSDGISESILAALARSSGLTVIARNSTFTFKGSTADVAEIGKALHAGYVLNGSVQKSADRMKLAATLVDAASGAQLWSETYDRPLTEVFAVQDQIADAVSSRMGGPTLDLGDTATAFDAYDYYLRGHAKMKTAIRRQMVEARPLLERAIEIDAAFAPAYADLAFSYDAEIAQGWDPPNRAPALARGLALARKAVALDSTLPQAQLALSALLLRDRQYEPALAAAQRAAVLDPNDAEAQAALANLLTCMNRAAEAVAPMQKALDLDPRHPPLYDMLLGRAYAFANRPDVGIPHLRNSVARAPNAGQFHLHLAAAYAQAGQLTESRTELTIAQIYYPIGSLARYRDSQSEFLPGPETDRFYDALVLAGLPKE